jgi:hypothetical protein
MQQQVELQPLVLTELEERLELSALFGDVPSAAAEDTYRCCYECKVP